MTTTKKLNIKRYAATVDIDAAGLPKALGIEDAERALKVADDVREILAGNGEQQQHNIAGDLVELANRYTGGELLLSVYIYGSALEHYKNKGLIGFGKDGKAARAEHMELPAEVKDALREIAERMAQTDMQRHEKIAGYN